MLLQHNGAIRNMGTYDAITHPAQGQMDRLRIAAKILHKDPLFIIEY